MWRRGLVFVRFCYNEYHFREIGRSSRSLIVGSPSAFVSWRLTVIHNGNKMSRSQLSQNHSPQLPRSHDSAALLFCSLTCAKESKNPYTPLRYTYFNSKYVTFVLCWFYPTSKICSSDVTDLKRYQVLFSYCSSFGGSK